jgi:DNA-binding Lrp family transcriptional regulator
MDEIDEKILAALQHDGRMSLTDLAARVGLSLSPCHRRVRDLERAGVISGYRAVVDPAAVDLAFEVLVFVTMARGDQRTVTRFEEELVGIPSVVLAQRLFGEPDYLLRVRCRDAADYQRIRDARLAALPGVGRLSSTLVMKDVVRERALELARVAPEAVQRPHR